MRISNLNKLNWVPQGDVHSDPEYIAEAPVSHLEVGDSIIHKTSDNIRKIVDIVPDAKMPDAYVKLHFEDGGGMTMPIKSNAMLPRSYKINFDMVGADRSTQRYERLLGHTSSAGRDSLLFKKEHEDVRNRLQSEGSIFHGVPLVESNPWLQDVVARRSNSFSQGSTGHLPK